MHRQRVLRFFKSSWMQFWPLAGRTVRFRVRLSVGVRFFLPLKASRPAVGPTKLLIQWVSGLRWPQHEADGTAPSNVHLQNYFRCTSIFPHCLMACCSMNCRGDFIQFWFCWRPQTFELCHILLTAPDIWTVPHLYCRMTPRTACVQ